MKQTLLFFLSLLLLYICFTFKSIEQYQSQSSPYQQEDAYIEAAQFLPQHLKAPITPDLLIQKAKEALSSLDIQADGFYTKTSYLTHEKLSLDLQHNLTDFFKNNQDYWSWPTFWKVQFYQNAQSELEKGPYYNVFFFPDGQLKSIHTWKYNIQNLDYSIDSTQTQHQYKTILTRFFPNLKGKLQQQSRKDWLHHRIALMDAIWTCEGYQNQRGQLMAYYRKTHDSLSFGLAFTHPNHTDQPFSDWGKAWFYIVIVLSIFLGSLHFPKRETLSSPLLLSLMGLFLVIPSFFLAYDIRDQALLALGCCTAAFVALFLIYQLFQSDSQYPFQACDPFSLFLIILTALATSYLCLPTWEGVSELSTWMRYAITPLAIIYLVKSHLNPKYLLGLVLICGLYLFPNDTCNNFANHACLVRWGGGIYTFLPVLALIWLSLLKNVKIYPKFMTLLQLGVLLIICLLGVGHVVFSYPW